MEILQVVLKGKVTISAFLALNLSVVDIFLDQGGESTADTDSQKPAALLWTRGNFFSFCWRSWHTPLHKQTPITHLITCRDVTEQTVQHKSAA